MRKRIHRFALLLVALTLALPICAQAVGEGDGWGAGAIHVPKNFKFSKLVNHGKGGVPPVATGTKGRKARQASQVLKAPQHSVFTPMHWAITWD